MSQECTVYVIDDDDAVRASICSLLNAFGIEAESFESGQAFLEALSGLRRGVVVLDWRMPGCGGATVLQALGRDLFPIVYSAHLDPATVSEAVRLGARDTIEKPSEPGKLVDAVRRGIECCRHSSEDPTP